MITISQNTIPSGGGLVTITLTKSDYLAWTSVNIESVSWCRVHSSSALNILEWQMEIEFEQNSSSSPRTLTIDVTTEAESASFVLTQAAEIAQPEAFVDTITPTGNISASGGNLTVDVRAENGVDRLTSASVAVGGNYVTLVSTTHGISTVQGTVTRFVFAFAANNTTSSRIATLSFTVSNGRDTDTVSITKTQQGTSLAANLVAVTPAGNINAAGGTLTLDVEAVNGNDSLTYATIMGGGAFMTLASTTHGVSSEGVTVTRFVFNFAQNMGNSARKATIKVYVSDGTNTAFISVTKTQDGAQVLPPSALITSETPSGSVSALGGLVTYEVNADRGDDSLTSATITSGASFVELLSTEHGIISGGYLITRFVFRVAANDTSEARSFAVRFDVSDGTLTASTGVSKNQDAGVTELEIQEPNYSVLPWYHTLEEQNSYKWWVYGKIYPLFTPAGYMLPFQIIRRHRESTTIPLFEVYTDKGVLVGDFTAAINNAGIAVKQFSDYDVIVFPARLPLFNGMANGRYYGKISDGAEVWYSEVFTVVNDIEPYLKIEWWDNEDFITDGGTVVYTEPAFHNIIYLDSDIAKPEYIFEEEGETRDGYFFPSKQISEKRYRFSFLAPEYLLDVMRLIRMADYVYIWYRGKRYAADTFLITPEWEDEGDIAVVDAEFETATVAKKLGLGYTRGQQGDYNDDYNEDYLN